MITAPGTGAEVEPTRRPGLDDPGGPDGHDRAVEPERFVDDRDALSYLYYLGHHLVPQGRGRLARRDLPGVDVRRARLRLARRRPVRRDDADVPHRAAQRVLHARDPGRRDDRTCCAGSTRAALLALIEREQITQVFGLPMMYRAVLDSPGLRRPRPAAACAARCTRWRRCPTTSSAAASTGSAATSRCCSARPR